MMASPQRLPVLPSLKSQLSGTETRVAISMVRVAVFIVP